MYRVTVACLLGALVPLGVGASVPMVAGDPVVFTGDFEHVDGLSNWTLIRKRTDPNRFSDVLVDVNAKSLMLLDFDWGGDPGNASAATPAFEALDGWNVDFDFTFHRGYASKPNPFTYLMEGLDATNGVVFSLVGGGVGLATNTTLCGRLPVRDDARTHLRLARAPGESWCAITLTEPGTGAKAEAGMVPLKRPDTKLSRLRFTAVTGWENMGTLAVRDLRVSRCAAVARQPVGELRNARARALFYADGRVDVAVAEPSGGFRAFGTFGVPALPGWGATNRVAAFRVAPLENDRPQRPRVVIAGIAAASQTASGGGNVMGVAALDENGRELFVTQWTLFDEALRMRLYPVGDVSEEPGRNLAEIPFIPVPAFGAAERIPVYGHRLHPTGGVPEECNRASLLAFDGAALAVAGAEPNLDAFYDAAEGRLRLALSRQEIPWQADGFCGALCVSFRKGRGEARREAVARAEDARLMMEVDCPELPFFVRDTPGEVKLRATVGNFFRLKQRVRLEWTARDIDGTVVANGVKENVVGPGAEWRIGVAVPAERPGPVFVDVRAEHEFAGDIRRVTCGYVPPCAYREGEQSRMGFSSYHISEGRHAERRSADQMFALMRQIGCSMIRQAYGLEKRAHVYGIQTWYHLGIGDFALKRDFYAGKPTWMDNAAALEGWLSGMVRTTRDTGSVIFDFTNELNIFGNGLTSKQIAERYAKVLLPAIRNARDRTAPEVKLSGLSIANADEEFIDTVAACGGWDMFDVVDFHASCVPRAPELDNYYWCFMRTLATMRQKLDRYGEKPLYISECYSPCMPNSDLSNNERTAADDMAVEMALCTALGVRNVMWYCFDDFEIGNRPARWNSPARREGFFGVIKRDWNPKVTLWAYATCAKFFTTGTVFRGDLERTHPGMRGLLFKGEREFAVLWSRADGLRDHEARTPLTRHRDPWLRTGADDELTVVLKAAEGASVRVTDVVGRAVLHRADPAGHVRLRITESPVFVEGAVLAPVRGEFTRRLCPRGSAGH